MVNIVNVKRCKEEGCDKHPTYGVEGTGATYCLRHAKEGMVNMKDRRCEDPGCKRQPSFGFAGSKHASFCMQHSEEGMINVIRRPCSAGPPCLRVPFFNFEGNKVAIFCSDHAKDGMIDVKTRRCAAEGCRKHPKYGRYEGTKRNAVFCALHAEPDMVRVVRTPMCSHRGCSKLPVYGKQGTTSAIFCAEHHEPGMVNVRDRQCVRQGCSKRPTHGFPADIGNGGRSVVCAGHAEEGMIDLEVRKTWVADGTVQVGGKSPQRRPRRKLKPRATPGVVGVSGNRHALYCARQDDGGGSGSAGEGNSNGSQPQSALENGDRRSLTNGDATAAVEGSVAISNAAGTSSNSLNNSSGSDRGKKRKIRSNSKKARLLRGAAQISDGSSGGSVAPPPPVPESSTTSATSMTNNGTADTGGVARSREQSTSAGGVAEDLDGDNTVGIESDNVPAPYVPMGKPTSPVDNVDGPNDVVESGDEVDDGMTADSVSQNGNSGGNIDTVDSIGESESGYGARSSKRARTSRSPRRVAISPRVPAPRIEGGDSGLPSSRTRSSKDIVKLE